MNYEEVINLLANKSPEERAELLKNEDIRNAVLSTGASVILYKLDGEEIKDDLSNVSVGVAKRKNKQGKPDGLGNFGGLAERTSEDELLEKIEELLKGKKDNSISEEDARQIVLAELFDKKDDIIKIGDKYERTSDTEIIREINVMREMMEELRDLGIKCTLIKSFTKNEEGKIINTTTLTIQNSQNSQNPIEIKASDLEYIKMPGVKDDNFIIQIWDGDTSKKVYAIDPCCHICEDKNNLLQNIENGAKAEENGEMAGFKRMPLFDALKSFSDYRYPHEYLGLWCLASNLLNHDSEKLKQLAIRVQNAADHPISLKTIRDATGQSDEQMAATLGIDVETLNKIEDTLATTYSEKNKKNIKSVGASHSPQRGQ